MGFRFPRYAFDSHWDYKVKMFEIKMPVLEVWYEGQYKKETWTYYQKRFPL